MKKIILSILLILFSLSMMAAPARPGRIVYTQPDGTTIGLHLHGDEFHHWMTDDNGNIVVGNEDGFIVPVGLEELSAMRKKKEEASILRAKNMAALKAAPANNVGTPEIPVLLIGFKDANITKTQAQFDAMLNLQGYSDNHAIGSVYDYFNENSFGQFKPHFDVLEAINLTSPISTYGNNLSDTYKALIAACEQLDSSVDFSKYDNDKDGYIDFIIFYFGGYDEAQCPDAQAYKQYIWSHATDISILGKAFDGVTVGKYFCTSELKGYTGDTMCSIGTTCHEFAHTLGLPDFYDVAYQEGTTTTESANMYSFDLMASGSYNGPYESTVPPYLNAEELMEIGWLDAIPEITGNGAYTLPSINFQGATAYSAYMTKTKVANEYFVYETRGGTRWDASLPTGLLVYHVDKSTNRIQSGVTAASVWNNNYVNSYASHPCCYVIPASAPTQTTLYDGLPRDMVFGVNNRRSYSPVAWDGNGTGFQLSTITYSSGTTTFNVVNSNALGVGGHVWDSDGKALSGVTISVEPATSSVSSRKVSNNPFKVSMRKLLRSSKMRKALGTKAASDAVTAVTNSEGYYSIELPEGTYNVTASKDGYVSKTEVVTVTSVVETQDFYLMREGEAAPSTIYAWPVDEGLEELVPGVAANSLTGQNLYPSSEMGKYVGKQLKEFSFFLYGDSSTSYKGVYVIIDYGGDRKATVPVSADDLVIGGYTTVDLRDLDLVVPVGVDIYAGVGFSSGGYPEEYEGTTYYYAFGAFFKTDDDDNLYDWAVSWPYDGLVSEYDLTATGERYSWDVIFDFTLTVGDYEAPDMGYNYIADPKSGVYSAGDVFELTLIETSGARKPGTGITWYLDDEPVSGTSVTLTAGEHVVEARFTTTEGKTKIVELTLTAK